MGIGLFTYNYSSQNYILPYHDFHGGILKKKLIENKIYQFQFYINRAENCEIKSNALDVVMTYDTIVDIDNVNGYGYKIWSMKEIFIDSINWIRINTCFKAKGGEIAFTVGNFHDTNDILMSYPSFPNQGNACNYLYLDKFSIIECPSCCPDQFPDEQQVYVFSNPSTQGNPANLKVWLHPNTSGELKIFDSAGRLVEKRSYSELENLFIFQNYVIGMYHYVLSTSDGELESGKVLVSY